MDNSFIWLNIYNNIENKITLILDDILEAKFNCCLVRHKELFFVFLHFFMRYGQR